MSTLWNKLWCVILSLALLINLLPASALAAEAPVEQAVVQHWVEDPPVEANEATTKPVEIVSEDTSKRGEYYKEFVLNNGLRMASLYAEPVHYSEGGQWKEIDNTLKLSAGVYTNTAGSWKVSFPQQLTKDQAVTITKDGYTLSFYMAGALYADTGSLTRASLGTVVQEQPVQLQSFQTATAQLQAVKRPEPQEETVYPQAPAEKSHARLEYANVSGGTDIVYDLSGNQVKESIIMDAYNAQLRGYRYTLNVGELTPVLTDSGEINLYDRNKEIVMVMPAPFLVDDAGEYCHDVELTLTGTGSRYTLTYLLPQQWLADADRQWPVVLDPVVEGNTTRTNIGDVTLYEKQAPNYNSGALFAGYKSEYGKMRSFMKYKELPALSSADVIVKAQLTLFVLESSNRTGYIEVHKVPQTWESFDLTWDQHKDMYDTTVEDFSVKRENFYYSWDITDIARGWYEGENTGLLLKASNSAENTTSTRYWECFFSSDYYDKGGPYSPLLQIVFRNNNGLESYWDYTSSSAGRAGTGSINDYTGNLVWIHSDLGFGGNRMPVSISHIYNANDSANNDFGLGYGWRTNYNQRAYKSTLANLDKEYYVWEDADGTDHYFYYDSKVGKYVDEDGLELTMTLSNGLPEKITDKDGNTYHFDAKGRLKKLENNQSTPSKITIDYVNDTKRISKITDGANRKYHFSYSGNLLTEISYVGSAATSSDGALPPAIAGVGYSYSGGCLTRITYDDGESSIFTYTTPPANSTDPKHLLLTAQDIDGYKLTYTYITQAAGKPSRVKTVKETHNGETGGTLTLTYAHNQTTFTDNLGNVQIKQFNNWGNTTAVQDDEGRAQFVNYTSNDPSEIDANGKPLKGNQLILSSKLQNTVGNLLRNSNFEDEFVWSAASDAPRSITTEEAYLGSKSLKYTKLSTKTLGGIVSGGFPVKSGETYTFSAYVKTGANANVWLSLGPDATKKSETLGAGIPWTRIQMSYTNDTDADVTCYARVLSDEPGPVYVDCAQLELAETASRYNIIENGDFRYDSSNWIMSEHCDSNEKALYNGETAAPELSKKIFQIVGDPSHKLRIRQEVPVSGVKGDTFVLAGWARGDGVPLTRTQAEIDTNQIRQFTLRGSFLYTDETSKVCEFEFNPDTGGQDIWQYAAGVMVAEKPFSGIKIQVLYDFGANTIYFDGIQLYKEEFGNSYAYDAKGNVTSVKDLQGQETKYEYTNNNLTEMTLPTGAKLTYEYDDYHNVTKATTEKGVVYEFEYDPFGNNTKVSITDASGTISSTATYSTDGNRLESTTDTLGNTTTYSYHPDTNVLEWVKYPKDTDVTKTVYTYDDMYRTAQAAVTTDTGLNLSAEYTYDNDLLMSIETARTTYDFSYGNFARRESVDIGERNLATYRYKPGTNWLETLDYGNEDFVQYTYDNQGRVIRQDYDGGAYVTYKYDNSGALAKVYDSQTGTTSTYYYDFTDRMMKYVETGSTGTHSVGYTYDNINNLTKLVETIGTEPRETSYTYDEDNRPTSISTNGASRSYTYDAFGRVSGDVIRHNGADVVNREYAYKAISGTPSNVLTRITYDNANYNRSFMINRDANGNIHYSLEGTDINTYQYDSANQLIRENNRASSITSIWTYDAAGNILTRETYPYNTGTLDPAKRLSLVNYTYSDTKGWGDLLTAYNGVQITHDEIGNPLNDGTWTYTWQHGRQLASMSKLDSSAQWSFTYNADGLRTQRTGSVTDPTTCVTTNRTYNYTYLGSQLTHMSVGEHTMYFAYDAAGVPLSLTYDSENYYYVTTIQGDVVSILNASGAEVVRYIYDAWGNLVSTTCDVEFADLGFYNPLRYRGYVYDEETKLYYLQSRYYNPEMGRFINADGAYDTNLGVQGYNMYAYCMNNPVDMYDPDGACGRFLGFLWKTDCKKTSCPDSKCYIDPNSVKYVGSYKNGRGNVFIVAPGQENDLESKIGRNDVVVVDRRQNSDNPKFNQDMRVCNSQRIRNVNTQREIIAVLDSYNKSNPVTPAWYRTEESMLIEWKAHNHGYRGRLVVGLIKEDAKERLRSVDFDNNAEGLAYWDYLDQ